MSDTLQDQTDFAIQQVARRAEQNTEALRDSLTEKITALETQLLDQRAALARHATNELNNDIEFLHDLQILVETIAAKLSETLQAQKHFNSIL